MNTISQKASVSTKGDKDSHHRLRDFIGLVFPSYFAIAYFSAIGKPLIESGFQVGFIGGRE